MKKRTYSSQDVLREAQGYLTSRSTYTLAWDLGVPQSTIWFHLNRDLKELDYTLYIQVRRKLEYNKKGP